MPKILIKKRQAVHQPLFPISNVFLAYEGNVLLGGNGTSYPVMFDTSSCDFWVDGYSGEKSTTFQHLNRTAPRLTYLDGTIVDGVLVSDSVKIANITIPNIQFTTATTIYPDTGMLNGVLGLCHKPLNDSTTSFLSESLKAGFIKENVFAFSIASDTRSAQLSLGGLDATKYAGEIAWIPVSPDSTYWEAKMTHIITSAGEINWTGSLRAIFDTGSSMLVLPPDLAKSVNAVFKFNKMKGSAVYSGACPENMPETIKFTFSDSVALIVESRTLIYGNGKNCYSSIADGEDGRAIVGNGILRDFYTIFDGGKHSVGFATSVNNIPTPVAPIEPQPQQPEELKGTDKTKTIIISVSLGLLALALLALGFYAWIRRRSRKNRDSSADTHENDSDYNDWRESANSNGEMVQHRYQRDSEDEFVPNWDFEEDRIEPYEYPENSDENTQGTDDERNERNAENESEIDEHGMERIPL